MLVKIVRHKGDRKHFALLVGATGNVTMWTDREPAQGFTLDVAEKVAQFYAGREHAGEIRFVDAETGATALPSVNGAGPKGEIRFLEKQVSAEVSALAELLAERDEFRRQAVALGDELEAAREEFERERVKLLSDIDALELEKGELKLKNTELLERFELAMVVKNGEIGELKDRLRRSHEDFERVGRENADLKLKNTELEALLADAK